MRQPRAAKEDTQRHGRRTFFKAIFWFTPTRSRSNFVDTTCRGGFFSRILQLGSCSRQLVEKRRLPPFLSPTDLRNLVISGWSVGWLVATGGRFVNQDRQESSLLQAVACAVVTVV